jgi:hypothetical protein
LFIGYGLSGLTGLSALKIEHATRYFYCNAGSLIAISSTIYRQTEFTPVLKMKKGVTVRQHLVSFRFFGKEMFRGSFKKGSVSCYTNILKLSMNTK